MAARETRTGKGCKKPLRVRRSTVTLNIDEREAGPIWRRRNWRAGLKAWADRTADRAQRDAELLPIDERQT